MPVSVNFGGAPNVKDAAQSVANGAWGVANIPYQQYTGQRVADWTGQQQQAMDMIQRRATNGSPLMGAAQNQLQQTLQGNFLNPNSNPYLSQIAQGNANRMADAYARGTGAQTMAQFRNAGAFGGSAMQETQAANNRAFADSVGQANNQLYGQAYQDERQNQMRSMLFAPDMANADYKDAQMLAGVGQAYQDRNQQVLNNNYADWVEAKNQPYKQLDVLMPFVGASTNLAGQQQQYDLAQQQLRQNKPNSAMNWLGLGLGAVGTLGNINYGGKSVLEHAGSWLGDLWS